MEELDPKLANALLREGSKGGRFFPPQPGA